MDQQRVDIIAEKPEVVQQILTASEANGMLSTVITKSSNGINIHLILYTQDNGLPLLQLSYQDTSTFEISKFKEGKKLRKDFLDSGDKICSRKKLYYHGNVNGKSDDEFGNILFIIRKRSFFNYFFLPNLMIPVLLFSAFTFFNEVPVLKTIVVVFSVLLIFNIIRNFFSAVKFYEYGMIVYKLSGKIRLEYKDIINFGSLFQNNKSESRFKIGTDSTKIDIDTMKHAVRFSVSTSRTGDKIHKEIMEFIPEIEKLF